MENKSTFAARLGRAALAAAVAAALLAGCKSEVYQGLTEAQANSMMSVLLKNGIAPEKTAGKEGYSIAVESREVARTLELMRENNLPRPDFENMGQIFAAKGMISSSTEEEARLTYALSQELAETFSQIDGVLTSRVHVVLGRKDIGTGESTPASAAVFLRHTPDSLAPNLVARIQTLTANAVPGLDRERVSVMLVPVRETITTPVPNRNASLAQDPWAIAAGAFFILALGGFGTAGWLYWRTRREAAGRADHADEKNEQKESGKPRA